MKNSLGTNEPDYIRYRQPASLGECTAEDEAKTWLQRVYDKEGAYRPVQIPGRKEEQPTRDIAVRPSSGVQLQSLQDVEQLAKLAVKGGFAPTAMSPAAAFCAIGMGLEVGLTPFQSLQTICIIKGKPVIWGDGISALLLASGKLAQAPEEWIEGKGPALTAHCRLYRKGWQKPIERCFSWGDAERAGLTHKENYKTYPQRQLRWRAFSWAARDGFADVLKGVYPAEEVVDFQNKPGAYGASEAPSKPPEPKPGPPDPFHEAAEVVTAEVEVLPIDPAKEPDTLAPPPNPRAPVDPEAHTEHPHVVGDAPGYNVERDELYRQWQVIMPRLTQAQLARVKGQHGVMRVVRKCPPSRLKSLIAAAETMLGFSAKKLVITPTADSSEQAKLTRIAEDECLIPKTEESKPEEGGAPTTETPSLTEQDSTPLPSSLTPNARVNQRQLQYIHDLCKQAQRTAAYLKTYIKDQFNCVSIRDITDEMMPKITLHFTEIIDKLEEEKVF